MANGEIDYGAVLSDMKAKRMALDSAITGLEQWLSLKSVEGQTDATLGTPPDRTGAPGEIDRIRFSARASPMPFGSA